MDQAKKSGGVELVAGAAPMPREMSFPLGASENWNDIYDYIRYMTVAVLTDTLSAPVLAHVIFSLPGGG